ncbi:unnamed protein product [Camellia sinensis]
MGIETNTIRKLFNLVFMFDSDGNQYCHCDVNFFILSCSYGYLHLFVDGNEKLLQEIGTDSIKNEI